jgi:hypothetical protein
MIKMLNAYTTEIDDVDAAAGALTEQIGEENLLKNSVGLLSCYSEFVDSGVIAALAGRLPFDIVGVTTMASATGTDYDMYALSLSVMTSDDVSFSTSITEPLTADSIDSSLDAAYGDARSRLAGDPSFIIALLPLAQTLSGADMLKSLDSICCGVPIFGTLSCDVTMFMKNVFTVRGGDADPKAAAMILMHGDVQPKFIISSLPDQNISRNKAVVTESEGCVVKKVNGLCLLDYLESVGMTTYDREGVTAVDLPIMVYYGDGSHPVALKVYDIFENGDALFAGEVPEGAYISIGQVDHDSIMDTAAYALNQIQNKKGAGCAIIFTCVSRMVALLPNQYEEIETTTAAIGGRLPYMLSYAGGEICPIYDDEGKTHNKLHSYTFTACIF